MKVFSVYDSKAEAYLQPFFVQSVGLAIRSFAEAANTSEHQFSRYAADFTLFEIGEFDPSHGSLKENLPHISFGTALEHLKRAPNLLQGQLPLGGNGDARPAMQGPVCQDCDD